MEQLTCSWCGEKRPADMPLCRKCNPHADRVMAVMAKTDPPRDA